MKNSSYIKIRKKYDNLVRTIVKETNCIVHSSFRKNTKENIIEIEILTLGEKIK